MTESTFFTTPAAFRQWLEAHHDTEKELLVGYYKTGSGKPGITWPQSVDEALCFGWIDGVRRSIDEESYCIRFTKRKPGSIWSAVNIAKVEKLKEEGKMQPEGLAAYEGRQEHKSKIYAFEQGEIALDKEAQKRLKANEVAWQFFTSQAPSYQKTAIWHILSAKQDATREKRLQELIDDSAAGLRIKSQRRNK